MKNFIFLLFISILLQSCVSYYVPQNNGTYRKETRLSPLGQAVVSGVTQGITNYLLGTNGYYGYYNSYGNFVYSRNYYTGNLYQYEYNNHSYCYDYCTLVGLGHRHTYRSNSYNQLNTRRIHHVDRVTKQYYYGVRNRKYYRKPKKIKRGVRSVHSKYYGH